MDAEDLAPAGLVRDTDDDFAVETAGATQRLVESFGPVGRRDDHRVLPRRDPVEQGEQLGDQPFLGLAAHLAALGRDRIDLVDEDDRGRRLRRLLENLAQPPLALAIGRAHDLGAGDREEPRRAFVRDRARQHRLAGPGRAVQQHALGRVDPEALEQLGMAQRQLDHLAQLVDRVLHSAEIVVGDVGAALAVLGGMFRQQLDDGLGVDVDDALGNRRHHDQPKLLKRERRSVEHLPDVFRHVGVDTLVGVGGDDIVLGERAGREGPPERIRRTLQPDIGLGRSEHDARRRLRLGFADLDEIARADPSIGALETVEPDDVDAFVFAVRADGPGRGRALADDFDHIAFFEAQRVHRRVGQARKSAPAVGRREACDLDLARGRSVERVGICHSSSYPALSCRMRNGDAWRGFNPCVNI